MTGDIGEGREDGGIGLQRAIVLLLLDRQGEARSVAELRDALLGCEGIDLGAALADLAREGVLELTSSEARVSRSTRRLDALNLIGI
jgi:hypothetical protein